MKNTKVDYKLTEPAQIIYAKLDPFNIGFYDPEDHTIYIDSVFQDDTELCDAIIVHEEKHLGKKTVVDFDVDMKHGLDKRYLGRVLKKKPLYIIGHFVPFNFVNLGDKRVWALDYFRLSVLTVCMGAIFVILKLIL